MRTMININYRFPTLLIIIIAAIICSPAINAQEVSFSDEITITLDAGGVLSVLSIDLDGDEDFDVLAVSHLGDKITWYENIDGFGDFGTEQIITNELEAPRQIYCADLDSDGDNDIVAQSQADDCVVWYENTDGLGDFGQEHYVDADINGPWSVFSTDIDGDGDFDVIVASFGSDYICWYENTDGAGTFGDHIIISIEVETPVEVFSSDIDGDGDYDLVSASNGDEKIAWYENTDGLGDFGPQQVIALNAVSTESVICVDLDGDEDKDVLVAFNVNSRISWYENTDGLGGFGEEQLISEEVVNAYSVHYADLDLDGDQDVLSASYGDDKIAWYENTDGLGNFGEQQIINDNAGNAKSVFCADLDGDGDFDVLTAASDLNKVAWYRNDFFVPHDPYPFDLLQPPDSSYIFSQITVLEWEEAADPDGDLSKYKIYISENPDDLEDSFIDSTTSTHYVFTGELNTQYWWTVLARDSLGHETWAEQVFTFTLEALGFPPEPFGLISPGNQSSVDSEFVTLIWESSRDPEDEYLSYWIYVSEYPDDLVNNLVTHTVDTIWTFNGEFGNKYWWTIMARDAATNETWADDVFSFTMAYNSVDETGTLSLPAEFELTSIYPNPFNPVNLITVGFPEPANLQISVYNLLGQRVASLASGSYIAGYHKFDFDGSGLSSGIYFVSVNVPGELNEVSKIVLMK